MNDLEHAYVNACVVLRERERAEEEGQRHRELVAAHKLAEERTRRARLFKVLLIVVVFLGALLWLRSLMHEQTSSVLPNRPASLLHANWPRNRRPRSKVSPSAVCSWD